MLKKIIITGLALFFLPVSSFTATAEGNDAACMQLGEKAIGDSIKYSLNAEVNGPVFFNDISCGIRYRNKELCAMEMIRFDTSGAVYDYHTSEKIELGKAYFWLDEKNPASPVLAFSSKEAAEKFSAEKENGVVLEYTVLTGRFLK